MADLQSHHVTRTSPLLRQATAGPVLAGLALCSGLPGKPALAAPGPDRTAHPLMAYRHEAMPDGIIIARLNMALNDARITPSIVALGGNRRAVRLEGTVRTEDEKKAALQVARLFVARDIDGVIPALRVDAGAPSKPAAGGGTPRPGGMKDDLKRMIEEVVLQKDPRISVQVLEYETGKYLARLDGMVPTEAERAGIVDTVTAYVPGSLDKVVSQVRVSDKALSLEDAKKAEAAKAKPKVPTDDKDPGDEEVEVIWPLTFGPEALNERDGNKLSANRYEIDTMVTALNKAFKKKAEDVDIVQPTRHSLLIKGSNKVVYKIRRALVQLDAPGPQVQLDLYAVQLSGQSEDIQRRHKVMQQRIKDGQSLIGLTPFLMEYALSNGPQFPFNPTNAAPLPRDGWYNRDLVDTVYANTAEEEKEATNLQKEARNNERQAIRDQLQNLQDVGFDLSTYRRFTLPEMLILMSVPDENHKELYFDDLARMIYASAGMSFDGRANAIAAPGPVVNEATIHGIMQLYNFAHPDAEKTGKSDSLRKLLSQNLPLRAQIMRLRNTRVSINGTETNWVPFWRLRNAYLSSTPDHSAVRRGINDFLKAVKFYQRNPNLAKPTELDEEKFKKLTFPEQGRDLRILEREANNPEYLARQAAVVDGLLKIAADALAADVQELFLDPVLDQLRTDNTTAKSSGGVSLVGRTRLVVTSGLQSSLSPEFQSAVDSTVPAPLDAADLLSKVLPTTADGRTGADRIFGGLPQAQAILLAGALAKPVVPSYTAVAPGVGVTVRPTVLGNGAAARLQIEASFGVESTAPAANATGNTWQPQPVDTVKKHVVATDALINGLDLFDISSFGLVTRHPRGPGYVPVIGRLPLIGPAFQWRRKDTQIDHDSVILVNAVILPRALDIVRYYSSTSTVALAKEVPQSAKAVAKPADTPAE